MSDPAELARLRRDWAALMSRLIEDRGPGAGPHRYAFRMPDRLGFSEWRARPTREAAERAWREGWGLGP